MIVLGDRRLDRLRVRPGIGGFGPVGTDTELGHWLSDAGIEDVRIDRRGVFAVFKGRKAQR
jgi:hypothetical protein